MPDMHFDDRNSEAMKKREAAVRKQHTAEGNKRRRSNTMQFVAIGLLGLGCVYLVHSNNVLAARAAGKDVVYALIRGDGEVTSSTHYTELPVTAIEDQQIMNAAWTYVQARDCYGSSSPMRQFYIAQAMSDQAVGSQVKKQFSPTNPEAPQLRYGNHQIVVQCELIDPPAPIGDRANNQYLFRFHRWEQGPMSQPDDLATSPIYSVTLRFRTGVYPDAKEDPRRAWLDRSTFNAPGVQIVDYPGAKPDNAAAIKHKVQS